LETKTVSRLPTDIVQQFLAEALVLTGTGGTAGIVLGVVASLAVSRYAD
jgi:ABC-type antimicrobial peptide transport system permease subunit